MIPPVRHPIKKYRALPPPQKFKLGRRIWRTVIGFTVLGLGIIMIVAPGPAIVVIPIGLAILATEYAWARRSLNKIKQSGEKLGTILLPDWIKRKIHLK